MGYESPKKSLKDSNDAKDKLFSIITHDLKNPFGTLLSLTEFLDNNHQKISEEHKAKAIHTIRRSAIDAYGLLENLTVDFHIDPNYFEQDLQSEAGAAFGIEPSFRQSAYFRFHNKSEDVDGLYFVGANTHPGAGVPGVLNSAKVIDRLVQTL